MNRLLFQTVSIYLVSLLFASVSWAMGIWPKPVPTPHPTPSPSPVPCSPVGATVPAESDEFVVNLKASNGKFVAAECGGDDVGQLNANRDSAGDWETFYVRVLPDGTATIRSSHGRFLSAENGGGQAVHANRQSAGTWETFSLSGGLGNGQSISFGTYDGQHFVSARIDQNPPVVDAEATSSGAWENFNVVVLHEPLPQRPSRDSVLSVKIMFQGLTVNTAQYGSLPWFEAALVSLSPGDRQLVYAAKHAAGDTHCIVSFAWSYDEPGQPYQQIPGRDFTNDPQDYADIVYEVIQAGFTPLLFMGGDNNYPEAVKELPLIVNALKNHPAGDLNPYVVYIPGWDSVFYGYTPEQIADFGNQFRSLLPDGYLGIEHGTGHIPVGNGPDDWTPAGPMGTYDMVLSEFNGWVGNGGDPLDDSVWQIAARLLGPRYVRPPEEPAGDDPNPPFYLLAGTSRGPFYAIAFEYDEYRWVRGWVSAAQVEQERSYFKALGYNFGDVR